MPESLLRALVVDDELAFVSTLTAMLSARKGMLELVGAARSVQEGVAQIKSLQPNLIFLDIKMGDGTGFDVLRRIEGHPVQVIFVTAYDHYAVEAFQFSAVDYLLKPVDSQDLWRAVGRAARSIDLERQKLQWHVLMDNLSAQLRDRKKLILKEAEAMHIVQLKDILWCEAEGSYTRFIMENGDRILVSHNLKEYERTLQANGFYRVHRSHMVNLAKIRKVDKRDGAILVLQGGYELPVSVRKREALMGMLRNS